MNTCKLLIVKRVIIIHEICLRNGSGRQQSKRGRELFLSYVTQNLEANGLSLIQWVPFSTFTSFAQLCLTLWPHGLQHTRLSCPSPAPGVYSNSCPFSQWCHPTFSSSVIPFSSCLQSFPVSGSFPITQFFTLGGQSIGASVSASVLPMNIQDWFPLVLSGLISLQSKGLSRVFCNTTVRKHKFFGAQLSL